MSVNRESISVLMTELADSFPMEADGRSSISDFGKLLFAEGHAANGAGNSASNAASASSHESSHLKKENIQNGIIVEEENDEEEDENDENEEEEEEEEEEAVDDEMTPAPTGTKRVYTEIKGVPRQKHHDVQCVVSDTGKIAISHGSMNKLMKVKDKAVPKRWTAEEDERLRQAVAKHGERNWKSIADEVPGRNHTQCLQRWTKVLAPGLVKGHWRPDEDELLKELVAEGRKNWGQVANRIPGRTSKQCRERWYNHLDPSIIRGEYTSEEDRIIVEAQLRLGNKWSTIAAMLPGRTEDAVKIRWKSLCRVRKGQNRRSGSGNGNGNGGSGGTNGGGGGGASGYEKNKAKSGGMGMSSGFNGNMVKSEELRAFAPIPTQATPMGRVPMMQPPQMMHHPAMTMNGVPTMVAYAPPGSYPSPMGGMGGYGKTVMMTPVNSYGQPVGAPMLVPSNDYNIDRRANAVNINAQQPSSGVGGGGPTYRPVYAASPSPTYGMDANGNVVYSHGAHGAVPTYMTSSNGAMYRVPSPVPMMSGHMPGQMMTSSYGYPMHSVSTPSSGEGHYSSPYNQQAGAHPGDQYAAAAQYNQSLASMQASKDRQQQHQQQQQQHQQQQQQHQQQYQQQHQQYEQHGQQTSDQTESSPSSHSQQSNRNHSAAATSKPTPQGPSLAAAFAQSLGSTPKAAVSSPAAMFAQNLNSSKTPSSGSSASPAASFVQKAQAQAAASSSSSSSEPATPVNPAAMFAQNMGASKGSTPSAAFKPSPVAAFLQKQNTENPSGSSNCTSSSNTAPSTAVNPRPAPLPFNPAAAFASRLQKPPMPSSSSSVKSTDDDEVQSEDGDEPSLKKVKPRNSIDMAARASAARRMRNSGNGNTLMGRRSLDVFLNEIGDVGRISDLKMDEFQTMDELWRVSGDMDRLSL